jgi:hypothetical protein
MELKEFIAFSLTQIVDGIRDAQSANAGKGVWISPQGRYLPGRGGMANLSGLPNDDQQYMDEVKFDVALSITGGKKGGLAAKVNVMSIALSAGGEADSRRSAVSRIQFSVPVVWPGSRNEQREQAIEENENEKRSER